MRFQSFFMLITNQLLFLASSCSNSIINRAVARANPLQHDGGLMPREENGRFH